MGAGDEILAAGQAQRIWDADPSVRLAIIGADGQPRWHWIWDGNQILATPKEVANGESVRRIKNGPHCRPYIVYPFTKESGWTFDRSFRAGDYPAKIYLTEAERARGTAALERYGPYVLIEPYTKHGNLQWPISRWRDLVASLKKDVTIVQHVHADSPKIPGAKYEPATFREACGLIASAAVYVRSESGLCHAAAAFTTPTVTFYGGCMDPEVMGGYPAQVCLADTGPGSPCGSWLPCTHCAEAMARLSVDRVREAVLTALRVEVSP